MPTRRSFLASAALAAPAFAQAKPKNILFLIADDLGLHTGAYGDKTARTPHLDALAADGVRFENAFCTTASCSPSRSVMLSGLQNHANGQYGLAHAVHHQGYLPFVQPLPSLLKDAGYTTGVIGKLHVNAENRFRWDLDQSSDGGRNGAAMAAKAKDFLAAAGSKPWYLHVGFTDPHRAAQGFANRDYPGIVRTPFDPEKVVVPPFLPDNTATRGEVAEYYEACNRMDQGVGAFIKLLKDSGQYDNTLIVFISDNGMPFPNAKTNLYDAGTHLPMIVRRPDQSKRGLVNQAMVSWTDLTPTFLDWAGARGPEYPLHGRSVLPILEQERPSGWDEVYLSHTFHEITMNYPMRAVRTRQYKYIRNLAHATPYPFASDLWNSKMWQSLRPEGNNARLGQRSAKDYLFRAEEELYDVSKDPHELVNLAAQPAHKSTLEQLRGKVKDFRVRTKDPWMILSKHSGEDESLTPPA
jgi:N-sulfoglucosamine sulfohydrolase